jgi:hypothetical protein
MMIFWWMQVEFRPSTPRNCIKTSGQINASTPSKPTEKKLPFIHQVGDCVDPSFNTIHGQLDIYMTENLIKFSIIK